MNKLSLILTSAVLASGISVAAFAQTSPLSPGPPTTSVGTTERGILGQHEMTGTIKEINHHTGEVKLDSKPINLTLHFPPDTLKDLKKGDRLTVHLSFSP